MSQAVADFQQVSKDYPDSLFSRRKISAVTKVSLRIKPGEVFGLVGPNRAGKTTLVKILLSLCRPTAGSVERLGRPAGDLSTLARVGYMHENHAFPRYLSAGELLHYYGALAQVPAAELNTRVPELLQRVGLADRSTEPIGRFSKGMVQRLGLAQALVNQPDLLVLDEPTEGLDLTGRQLLRAVIRELREMGRTVLLISHVLTELEPLCDRIGVLVQGRVVRVGTPADIKGDQSLEAALGELYEKAPS